MVYLVEVGNTHNHLHARTYTHTRTNTLTYAHARAHAQTPTQMAHQKGPGRSEKTFKPAFKRVDTWHTLRLSGCSSSLGHGS